MNQTSKPQFRNTFQPGDIGRIILLHALTAHARFEYDFRFEAYVAENLGRFASQENPRNRIWMVDDDQGIVGTIAIVDTGDDLAQLRWLAVHPRACRKGIGAALLQDAVGFCRQQHYKEVFLWTVKGQDIAIAMYDKAGFELTEENTSEVWGKTLTEQKMRLSLA